MMLVSAVMCSNCFMSPNTTTNAAICVYFICTWQKVSYYDINDIAAWWHVDAFAYPGAQPTAFSHHKDKHDWKSEQHVSLWWGVFKPDFVLLHWIYVLHVAVTQTTTTVIDPVGYSLRSWHPSPHPAIGKIRNGKLLLVLRGGCISLCTNCIPHCPTFDPLAPANFTARPHIYRLIYTLIGDDVCTVGSWRV